MVFVVEYSPSSCLSFFSDMGSLESILLAGNTSCIPVIVAVPDMAKLLARGRYYRADEVIDIHLDEVSKGIAVVVRFWEIVIALVARYIVSELVAWEGSELHFTVIMRHVTCRLRCRAEEWR